MKRCIAAVIMVLVLSPVVRAQVPEVIFYDGNLKAAVQAELGVSNITVGHMLTLTYLQADNEGITSLVGLENARNLNTLWLGNNQISDISPLGVLTKLNNLKLCYNRIIDIPPLERLTNLSDLDLTGNQIIDISPLEGLTKMESLFLGNNEIIDLFPLAELTSLQYLYLENNQISDLRPLEGLTSLEALILDNNQIIEIFPLEGLTSLMGLCLGNNKISDIFPLEGLTMLEDIYLSGNQISNLSPLDGLTSLFSLQLANNQISDISPLEGLTSLMGLFLENNQISDISPLVGLTSLQLLYLTDNPLNPDACNIYILQLQANGTFVAHDFCVVDPQLEVEVPNVVGMLQADAVQFLTDANFTVYIIIGPSDTVEAGYVAAQDPTPRTVVSIFDASVTLTISTGPAGPETVEVPGVVGMLQTHAEQELTSAGFTVAIVNAPSETVPADHVISQYPFGGTQVAVGSAVTLTVSTGPTGPEPEMVAVPGVVGMLQTHAEQELTSAGFTVAIVNASSETVPADHVISQNPVAGTQVAVGSAVTLTISTGPGGDPGSSPEPGLSAPVAHWALDEATGLTAFDSTGTNDGLLHGNPIWLPDGGMVGGALRFDGIDDYVDCGTFNPSAATGQLTVSVWANWEGPQGGYQGLIGKRDGWDGQGTAMMWCLEIAYDTNVVRFLRGGSYPWGGDVVLPQGQWTHVAVTFDGTTQVFYVDGQETGRDSFSFGSKSDARVVFGCVEAPEQNPFNGSLDDIRLYEEALSPAQVQAVMVGGMIDWDCAAYWDTRYPSNWAHDRSVRDALESAGYEILNADQLKTWMDARISDGAYSVVVFCQDVAPDTVYESASSTCTLRRYLDAGGKIVWYGDIPLYYQGHSDRTMTTFDLDGSLGVLGFRAAGGVWEIGEQVTLTDEGRAWGLTDTWPSVRPAEGSGLRILARDSSGLAAAWVKHYLPGDTYAGFVRFSDCPFIPNIEDIRRLAEYPNALEPAGEGGLVAHYEFEGNAEDSIGGNHGTEVGNPTYVIGVTGMALDLNGAGDYVECGNPPALNPTDAITVAAWVQTRDAGNGEHNPYVTKGDHSFALKHQWESNIEFFIYDADWQVVRFPVDTSFNSLWHHLAGTYDGRWLNLYVDGTLQATREHVGSITPSSFNVNIGRNSEATDRFYDGRIDEVQIYDRALSQEEILDLL